jgi:hypothetical protein
MMKETRILLDGGELIYDGMSVVPVGDRGIPKVVTYRHPGDTTRPACEVRIEVWDGVPAVAKVTQEARREDGVQVRVRDIKLGPGLNLEDLIGDWLAEVAYRPVEHPRPGRRGWQRGYPVPDTERRHTKRTVERARRRRLNAGQLRTVAEMYAAANPPKHEAIALAFDVSPRTAQRYIEKAREAELLPPTTHGKTD